MSRRTLRVIDLMCRARNQQWFIESAQKELSRYDGRWHRKAEAEDEVCRSSQKRDATVTELRSLLDQLDRTGDPLTAAPQFEAFAY